MMLQQQQQMIAANKMSLLQQQGNMNASNMQSRGPIPPISSIFGKKSFSEHHHENRSILIINLNNIFLY